MHINNINNNQLSPKFEALKVRKLNKGEISQLKSIDKMYDEVFAKLSKYNYPSRVKFKSPFPGLFDKTFNQGLLLHVGDDLKSKFHVHRFGQKNVKLDLLDDNKKPLLACSFANDEITIKTSEEYDSNLQNDSEKSVLNLFENAITEMKLLVEYTRAFDKIRKILPQNNTKKEIRNLIAESKKESVPAMYSESEEVKLLLEKYNKLNKSLYHRHGAFTAIFKEMYFKNKDFYREKGVTFETADAEKINFLPLNTQDGRMFRIYRYDKNNKLKFGLFGYSDGTMSRIKNIKRQVIPENLTKITDAEIAKYEVPKMIDFLCVEVDKFDSYINNLIKTHKIIRPLLGSPKIIPISEYEMERTRRLNLVQEKKEKRAVELNEKKRQKEIEALRKAAEKAAIAAEKAAEKQKAKALKKAEMLKRTTEAKAQKLALKAEKVAEKERAKALIIEQKEKRMAEAKAKKEMKKTEKAATKRVKTTNLKSNKLSSESRLMNDEKIVKSKTDEVSNNSNIINNSQTLNEFIHRRMPISEVVANMDKIFATPVNARHPRYSHTKLKDGSLFTGKFSIKADDGANISVTKIKSQHYVDFTYYSVCVEKDGEKAVINLDPKENKIIYSDSCGKPIIINGVVKYLSQKIALSNIFCAENWNSYIYQLFNSESQDGKIEETKISRRIVKQSEADEILESLYKEIHLASLYKFD